jgi:hypothetical protein
VAAERRDRDDIENRAELLRDELDDETDDDLDDDDFGGSERVPLDRSAYVDPDEVEADEELLLDRKELNELGLELDNPEGFADE